MRHKLAKAAGHHPKVKNAAAMISAEIAAKGLSHEQVSHFLDLAEFVLENPQAWPQAREKVIASGAVSEQFLPEEYRKSFLLSLIAALQTALNTPRQQSPLRAMTNAPA